jgi:hypothetical protein
MLLAQSYAASRIDRVAVSDQQIKDRYAKYVKQMAEEGQKAPPLDKVKDQVRLRVRADNLMNELQGDRKVVKNEDVIKKYLDNLSTSSALLQSQSDLGQPSSAPPASKPGKE